MSISDECWIDDRRMKVLFSPLRQREVNPENYDSQIRFWREQIRNHCRKTRNPTISLSDLRTAFVRKGQKPHCLDDVLDDMLKSGDIKPVDEFLQESQISWKEWSFHLIQKPFKLGFKIVQDRLISRKNIEERQFVHMEVVNSQADSLINSFRNQIISLAEVKKCLPDLGIAEDIVSLVLHELRCRQKLQTFHLDDVHTDEKTIFKFGTESHKAFPFTDLELAIHKLEYTERDLLHTIGGMEEEVHRHEEAAKKFLLEKKRVLAKNSLRKRDSLIKKLEQRTQCLENVQALIEKIHGVSEDAKVLDAYRTGTKSLQLALSKSGITLDTVEEAINQMQDVIEIHDAVKEAIATGGAEQENSGDDALLEKELEELVADGSVEEKECSPKETEKVKGGITDNEADLIAQVEKLSIVNDALPIEICKSNSPKKEAELCSQ